MESSEEYIYEKFLEEFGEAPRPQVFGNPDHCSECAEAESLISNLDQSDLNMEDLDEWFFPSWAGDKGLQYFFPGIIRLLLEKPADRLWVLDAFTAEHLLPSLTVRQAEAIRGVIRYCQDMGFSQDNFSRQELRDTNSRIVAYVEQDVPPKSDRAGG